MRLVLQGSCCVRLLLRQWGVRMFVIEDLGVINCPCRLSGPLIGQGGICGIASKGRRDHVNGRPRKRCLLLERTTPASHAWNRLVHFHDFSAVSVDPPRVILRNAESAIPPTYQFSLPILLPIPPLLLPPTDKIGLLPNTELPNAPPLDAKLCLPGLPKLALPSPSLLSSSTSVSVC